MVEVKRYYIEDFDEEIHESTAELMTLDICADCEYQRGYIVAGKEEEKIVPPYMECDICGKSTD